MKLKILTISVILLFVGTVFLPSSIATNEELQDIEPCVPPSYIIHGIIKPEIWTEEIDGETYTFVKPIILRIIQLDGCIFLFIGKEVGFKTSSLRLFFFDRVVNDWTDDPPIIRDAS